jgi:hypothetical protein
LLAVIVLLVVFSFEIDWFILPNSPNIHQSTHQVKS